MIDDKELKQFYFVDKSGIHGRGLFARVAIEQGEYMGTYHGPEVEENGMHVLWVEGDDGEWRGRDGKNLLRYLNHSRTPHAEFDGFDLYAAQTIAAGTEITIDYGEEP
jgi:uncharacterized protein